MKVNFETNKNLNTDKLLGNVSSACRRKKTSTVSTNGTEPYHKQTNKKKCITSAGIFFLFFFFLFLDTQHLE